MKNTPLLPRTASQACLAALKDSPQGSFGNLVVPKARYIRWKAEGPDPKVLPGHSVLKDSRSAERGGDQPLQSAVVHWGLSQDSNLEKVIPNHRTVCRQVQDLEHVGS